MANSCLTNDEYNIVMTGRRATVLLLVSSSQSGEKTICFFLLVLLLLLMLLALEYVFCRFKTDAETPDGG